MIEAQEVRRVRRWRSVSEKRQIVQLTLEPGARVADVARAHGLNANQVFKWRRAFERGELSEPCSALLPVAVGEVSERSSEHDQEEHDAATVPGSIHIEFPGRANISIKSGTDPMLFDTFWSACASDPSSNGNEDLDRRRRDRHAARRVT